MGVVGRNPSSYGGLQAPLQRFIRQRILEGKEATRENLQSCLINIMDEWYPEMVRTPLNFIIFIISLSLRKHPIFDLYSLSLNFYQYLFHKNHNKFFLNARISWILLKANLIGC